jgi:SSS family solute:Na+ symporter
LLFNGVFKIPMQFSILTIGVLLFVFYSFIQPPVFFNQTEVARAPESVQLELSAIEADFKEVFEQKKSMLLAADWSTSHKLAEEQEALRASYMELLESSVPNFQPKDTDYVFITFVLTYLPKGLVGLLLAVIISAAMSSTAGEVSALATTTYVDYYRVFRGEVAHNEKRVIRSLTAVWGVAAIFVALAAPLYENLIQLVNVLGSLFYGTILGIFLIGLFIKHVKARALFIAAVVGQVTVLVFHTLTVFDVVSLGFLWYNVIGSVTVLAVALTVQRFMKMTYS